MSRWTALLACGLALAPAPPPAVPARRAPVPVMIRPFDQLDACPSTGRPRLPPGGRDGYLSVRAGPGTDWPEVARLRASDLVFECDGARGWTAVIVQPPGGGNCAIPSPGRRSMPYRGPCRYGWAADRFLETVAG